MLGHDPASPRAAEKGYFLLRSRAESARMGYSSQDMTVWGADGECVAVSRQCVAIFDKKPDAKL